MYSILDTLIRWWRRDRAVLDALRPGLRALIAARVAQVPDYIPAEDARQLVLGEIAGAVDHSLGHLPQLAIARSLLLVAARSIVEGVDQGATVAVLKARAIDIMTVRVNSVQP